MPLGLAATMVSGSPEPLLSMMAPKQFRSGEGVRSAWPSEKGPFGRTPKKLSGTQAQKAGKRYERKVLKHLGKSFGLGFIPQPWFRYLDSNGKFRWCQPDAIYISEAFSAIFEIKIRLVPEAWWQLRKLYYPIVRSAYKISNLGVFLICKHVDPETSFPESYKSIEVSQFNLKDSLKGWDYTKLGLVQWTL